MQVFDPGLLCSSFLSSQWHCKAYDIISLVDVINPNSKWGSIMFSADSWESFHPLSKKGKYIITEHCK